jgi:hypothetical protein
MNADLSAALRTVFASKLALCGVNTAQSAINKIAI